MGKNIFNIKQEYIDLIDQIETSEGEITEDVSTLLELNKEDFKEKMDAYAGLIKILEAEIELAKDRIKSYQSKIKAKENTIERLKKVMLDALETLGDTNKAGKKILKTDEWSYFIKETPTVDIDPIQFTINNDKTHAYLSVEVPLVLSAKAFNALKDMPVDDLSDDAKEAILRFKDTVYTVKPDRKLLTSVLKVKEAEEVQPTLEEVLFNSTTEDAESVSDAIPGVKYVVNKSLQVR